MALVIRRKPRRTRRVGRIEELDGAVVNVELLRFPKGGVAPVGRVIEILGKPGDLGVDTEIIIRKHHLPHEFSAKVLEEAERRAQPVHAADLDGREDFRKLPIVTIDGETARDFDDAVYVERRADGGWHLQVHIADVAHYVRTATALDNEARPARHLRLFYRSRSSDAARIAFKRHLLAEAARRPPGDELPDGVRRQRAHARVANDARCNSFRGTHDLHQRQQSDRRRRGSRARDTLRWFIIFRT